MPCVMKGLEKLIVLAPLPDEIEAILEAKADTSPTISHNEINWD